nr:tyrosine-type recombinase/integrase [Robbsia betulipollinis]
MLARLAEEKRKIEVDVSTGSLPRLVQIYMTDHQARYADSFRKEWIRRGECVRTAFAHWDIEQVDAGAIDDFLRQNWGEKLSSLQAMHGWMSKFFSWAVVRRYAIVNPCREVSITKPKIRRVYITDHDFMAIRQALGMYVYTKRVNGVEKSMNATVPTGAMMQVFVDLCYLTCQRSTEIRHLRWSQVDYRKGVIHFVPSKTASSTGEAVDWPIIPSIASVFDRAKSIGVHSEYVIHDHHGQPKTDAACRDAWRDGKRRAGLEDRPYTVKDIRAKAMTDAKRQGYDLDALQIAGAHADRATTAGYIKSRDIPVSTVKLDLPSTSNA